MDRREPAVSVVVPARDAARTIGAALDSALHGQDVPLEVIVIDDGSCDGTAERVSARLPAEPRLRLLRTAGAAGASAARNLGIEAARGAWIAPLDADDRFAPGRLARLLSLASEHAADMVGDDMILEPHGDMIPKPHGDMIPKPHGDMIPKPHGGGGAGTAFAGTHPPHLGFVDARGFVLNNMFHADAMGWGYMKPLIRRDLLLATGMRYDPAVRIAEDYHFYLDLIRAGARFLYVHEPLYHYALTPGSLSRSLGPRDLEVLAARTRRDLDRARASGDAGLVDAFGRRLAGIESLLLYGRFVDALKGLRIAAAVGLGFRFPVLWPLILRYGRESVAKRLMPAARA
jgi:glycosyltransferase involved in cell wall biosynthesis